MSKNSNSATNSVTPSRAIPMKPSPPRQSGAIRRFAVAAALAVGVASLGACVVAPVGPHGGAVYVAPTYPIPAVGYVWKHHHHHGWGWRHPRKGWHRGWH